MWLMSKVRRWPYISARRAAFDPSLAFGAQSRIRARLVPSSLKNSSTSALAIFIGGLIRITLPYSPPPPISKPLRRAASSSAFVLFGAGVFDSRSSTNSSACISPLAAHIADQRILHL